MSSRKKRKLFHFMGLMAEKLLVMVFLKTVSSSLDFKSIKAKRLDDFPMGTQTVKKELFHLTF